jgi:hypothetical protein
MIFDQPVQIFPVATVCVCDFYVDADIFFRLGTLPWHIKVGLVFMPLCLIFLFEIFVIITAYFDLKLFSQKYKPLGRSNGIAVLIPKF